MFQFFLLVFPVFDLFRVAGTIDCPGGVSRKRRQSEARQRGDTIGKTQEWKNAGDCLAWLAVTQEREACHREEPPDAVATALVFVIARSRQATW